MNLACPICSYEQRNIDGFDLIAVLGLMKEYNWREIWRRYQTEQDKRDSVSMYFQARNHFLEMHVQKMHRIILSEKFNTNPFFMQQVIQRITASHNHDLILDKIRKQGIDGGENPICLSCSMGNIIIDLIVNKNEPFSQNPKVIHGSTEIETKENRPLDIYDLSSILYLCQQNLTESIFRRYMVAENGSRTASHRQVHIRVRVGDYNVSLFFNLISTSQELTVPPPGNASVATRHPVLQRMNFRHSLELTLRELQNVGLAVALEQIQTEFSLHRYINNTALRVDFSRLS
ncbi:MAG: hypothetical protein HY912_15605 [Desulfomonile tiedjei]|uniref:Uncharacterized protein n=1 Tax=Desulfomonile tiedjei TaxID=2358 RepID=A0A9D6V2Z2_9BACT|nr:hypothetical protein [Desulfomonile tiedjei]